MHSAVIFACPRYPAMQLAPQPAHERAVRPGPLVLGSTPLKPPTPTTDTDRTVSRRSEPSSCTTLTGEQPDPWDLLQPQDVISRHRGAKPRRRYRITTAYFRTGSTCPSHRQAPFCCYTLCVRVPTALRAPCARLRYSFGGDRPSQTARLPRSQGGFASLW